MKALFGVMFLSALSFGQTAASQDADALEAQYGTCAKHSIPADKCTAEIYQQLKAKDNAPLDPTTAAVLKAVREYQSALKNPESMQVRTAYVTNEGAVCLEIGGQNGMGGMTVSRVVYLTEAWPHRGKGKWMDEGGWGGKASADFQRDFGSGYEVDRWPGYCQKLRAFGGEGHRFPGTDVTEKVNQALKLVKEPETSTSQPTAHGTIGSSPDGNPRIQHAASMPEPEASTSQPTAHGTIGTSCDGNPLVRHDGVTVSQVVTGGPAAQAGIEVGDVILAIDDHYLYTIEELNNAVDRCKPGSTIKIRYRRYSMTYEASLIVGNREAAKTEH